jgi:predicted AlkP superfamily phosphohydrolase/phosphomutase
MNVPTTTPARSVEGFIIGSAGGGLTEVNEYSGNLAYPAEVIPILEKHNYIVDTRFRVSGIRDLHELFDKVIKMERIRADTFVELCQQQTVDLGFLVNTGIRTIQYLAMSEIEPLLNGDNPDPESEKLITKLYKEMDKIIESIITRLEPEHVIITADHGQAPMKYRANANRFLERHGWFIRKKAASTSMMGWVHKSVRKVMPKKLLTSLRKNLPAQVTAPPTPFDRDKTIAFGQYYVSGIYINDSDRFGGPVEQDEVARYTDQIMQAFNDSPEATTYNMRAEKYRSLYSNEPYSAQLPDLIIHKPDPIFFDGRGEEFVEDNPVYAPLPEDLDEVFSDMFTGTKGSHPIMYMDTSTAALLNEEDPIDLTVTYKLVDRLFS